MSPHLGKGHDNYRQHVHEGRKTTLLGQREGDVGTILLIKTVLHCDDIQLMGLLLLLQEEDGVMHAAISVCVPVTPDREPCRRGHYTSFTLCDTFL